LSSLFDTVVWRYEPTGVLDTTFGGQGWVVHRGVGDDMALDILVDSSGEIVLGGFSPSPGIGGVDVTVWRYRPDGTLRSVVRRDSGGVGFTDDAGRAMTEDPSGDIFIAGTVTDQLGDRDMALWRYR
jgi:hypothetical protein